jgi:hypothetical protein
MPTKYLFSATLIFVGLCGCHQTAPPTEKKPHASAAIQPASNRPAIDELRKGMPYANLRKVVLESGWLPVVDKQCKSNVVGDDYSHLCSAHPDLDDCRVCDELPELGSCSGDGYCGMTFKRGGKELHVTTYGMIEDRSVRSKDSRLEVSGWKVENESAQ